MRKHIQPIILGVTALGFIIGAFIMQAKNDRQTNQLIEYEKQEQLTLLSARYSGTITDSLLSAAIKAANIKFPYIVHAQAVYESANFRSGLFGRNHNLFGMRYPGSRVTTAIGEVRGFAYYDDWVDSLIDYALWFQTYAHKCKTDEDVYRLLDKQYALQPGYSGMIRRLAEQYKKFY